LAAQYWMRSLVTTEGPRDARKRVLVLLARFTAKAVPARTEDPRRASSRALLLVLPTCGRGRCVHATTNRPRVHRIATARAGEVQRCNWSMASAVRQDGQLTVRSRRLVISETSRVGPRLFDERKELRRLQRRAEVKSLVLIACQLRQQGELLWCIRAIRGSGSTARDC